MSEANTTTIKNDIEGAAESHVLEALQYLDSPIHVDMDEDQVRDLVRSKAENYSFDGINTCYEAFLIVGSSEFPSAESSDFTGQTSSLECLSIEANDIASQVYYEALGQEVNEAVERIMAIIEKAVELGYDGALNFSGSSVYGWEAHNYETDCGICIWSDERVPYAYNPSLLEGELWAIEGTVSGLHLGACWVPDNG